MSLLVCTHFKTWLLTSLWLVIFFVCLFLFFRSHGLGHISFKSWWVQRDHCAVIVTLIQREATGASVPPSPKKKMLQRRKRLIWLWNIQFASFYSESARAAPLSPPPRGWLRRRDSRTWIRCYVPSVAQAWHVKDVSVVVTAAADGRVDLWTHAFIFRPSVNCRGTAYSDSCLNPCLGRSVTLTTVTFKGIKECGTRLQHWRFFSLCILTNILFFCLYFQFI